MLVAKFFNRESIHFNFTERTVSKTALLFAVIKIFIQSFLYCFDKISQKLNKEKSRNSSRHKLQFLAP